MTELKEYKVRIIDNKNHTTVKAYSAKHAVGQFAVEYLLLVTVNISLKVEVSEPGIFIKPQRYNISKNEDGDIKIEEDNEYLFSPPVTLEDVKSTGPDYIFLTGSKGYETFSKLFDNTDKPVRSEIKRDSQ